MFPWLLSFFTNPLLMAGAAAAAIPIIIHLVYRRRAPRVSFSTLRFIRMSAERTARRRRIREWLLLALRAAVIFFLALALAGPILRSARLSGGRGAAAVALVMDDSYSMATSFEGRTRYAGARDYALEILRGLSEDGQAALLYAWPTGRQEIPPILTADRNRLGDELTSAEVSIVPGDLAAAVQRADELLRSAPTDQREIYVFSDLQKATWRAVAPDGSDQKRPPSVIVVDCGTGDLRNLAVTSVRLATIRPAAGVPLTIQAEIRNYSSRPEDVALTLHVDRQKAGDQTVRVGANSTAEVSFPFTFETPGTHIGWVEAQANDALELDNRRYFSVEVPEKVRVALVREREGPLPQMDEAFFLAPALSPSVAAGTMQSMIEPVLLLHKDLAGAKLSDYAAVFLLNLPDLSSDEAAALGAYVNNGGGLIVFPGDDVNAPAWNGLRVAVGGAEEPLLPCRLDGPVEVKGEPVALLRPETEHPIFAPFLRLPEVFFTGTKLQRHFELYVEHGSRGQVLAQLSDGKPFLAERALGLGRVLVFCCPATAQWGNLPSRTLYLPMLHQVVYHVARRGVQAESYVAGNAVRFPAGPDATPIEVTDPRGVTLRATTVEGEPGSVYRQTYFPGIYRWRHAGRAQDEGAFAVNLDAKESDPALLTQKDLAEQMLPGRDPHFARNARDAQEIAMRIRQGVPLSTPILVLVLGLALAECFLANRIGLPRPAAKPAPVTTATRPA